MAIVVGFDPFAIAGLLGVGVGVGAYLATQNRSIRADGWQFPTLNLVACILIGASTVTQWNTATAVMQAIYGTISLYGIYRWWSWRP